MAFVLLMKKPNKIKLTTNIIKKEQTDYWTISVVDNIHVYTPYIYSYVHIFKSAYNNILTQNTDRLNVSYSLIQTSTVS